MKRLLLLLLIPLLWATPVEAAVMFESYSDVARTIQSDNFTAQGSWVYLKGTGLAKNKAYRTTFFDAQNATVLILDSQSDGNGVVLSQVKPSAYPTSSPGIWKAELWKVQPLTLEATDTFTVQGSAIPEFPDVFAGITVSVAVGFIFILVRWMKKRKR